MKSDDEWDELVRTAATIPFNGDLHRIVAQLTFEKGRKYLFTSARRNRCNPDGVSCLYMAEDRDTALCEYDKYYTDCGDNQPYLVYAGALKAKKILDLGNPATVKHLGLTDQDFTQAFRVISGETPLEQLGRALSRQKKVCAIRFPSDAMRSKSAKGFNIAVFKDALVEPDSLEIVGQGKTVLERWP